MALLNVILPLFNFGIKKGEKFSVPDLSNFKTYFLIVIGLTFLSGLCRLTFNDDIKALYVPPKSLLKAETLYKNIYETKDKSFIIVKGKDLDEISKNEEKITQNLENENVPYISLTKLVPSERKQKENQKLIKELYLENLDVYANFLDKSTISKLKNSFDNDKVESLDLFKYPYLKNVILNTPITATHTTPTRRDLGNGLNSSRHRSTLAITGNIRFQRLTPML